jgi:UDP-N-acetylmuramoylalanine--D-glutamate ligase
MESFESFEGKRVLVVGMARSGQAAARWLAGLGARVTGTDIREDAVAGAALAEFEALSVDLVTGSYPPLRDGQYDLVLVSPGVPLTIPPVQAAAGLGIPVWSELELASRFVSEPIIAVTGTNGKTTTTALIGYIFQQAGRRTLVAGNIGIPLIQEVERARRQGLGVDYWVIEVSSFQLERSFTFHPHIAVLLNLTPDHLDRHATLEEYGRVKMRVFANQDSGDFAVLNLDDPWVAANAGGLSSGECWFSTRQAPCPDAACSPHSFRPGVSPDAAEDARGMGVDGGNIVYRRQGAWQVLCPVEDVRIPGRHNLANALAAASAALLAGIDPPLIARSLSTFPGVPHRLEPVAVIDGVRYVNDSKGTNPDSVLRALDSYREPIILIAGGKPKGSDFSGLAAGIASRVKALILLGQAAPQIEQAVRACGYTAIWNEDSLEGCVRTAARLADVGDLVLLSPACASWDMFRDYEERGDLFKQLVLKLDGSKKERSLASMNE